MRRLGLLAPLAVTSLLACSSGSECGEGTTEQDGQCVATQPDPTTCGPGLVLDDATNTCVRGPDFCGPGATVDESGVCVGSTCAAGTMLVDGECLPDGSVVCQTGTTYDADSGTCVADITGCAAGTVQVADQCLAFDDTLVGMVPEAPEPNEAGSGGETPLDLPAEGELTTLEGCAEPRDITGDGNAEADWDAFTFTAPGPVLLRITVDGLGGLAGAYRLSSNVAELDALGWRRSGASIVNDTVVRTVFLPEAGEYTISFGDGRGLVSGLVFGGSDTCYFATVEHIPTPAPTPLTGTTTAGPSLDTPRFLSLSATEGQVMNFFLRHANSAGAGALVSLVNGVRMSASPEQGPGVIASASALGLRAGDQVVVVVDSAFNYNINPVDWELRAEFPEVQPLPETGAVTLTHSPAEFSYLYFDTTGPAMIEMSLGMSEPAFFRLISGHDSALMCSGLNGCITWQDTLQVPNAGRHYIQASLGPAAAGSYQVTVVRTELPRSPITVSSTLSAQTLSDRGDVFYELDASTLEWIRFAAALTGFPGDLGLRFHRSDELGPLSTLELLDEQQIGDGGEAGRLYVGDDRLYTLHARSVGGFDGDEVFDLRVEHRAFLDAGTLTETASFTQSRQAFDEDEGVYVLARTPGAAHTLDVNATGFGTDLQLGELTRQETLSAISNATGLDGSEQLTSRTAEPGWSAYLISGAPSGEYTMSITATPPVLYGATTSTLTFTDACPNGSALPLSNDDDGLSPAVVPAFPFEFFGTPVTEMTVSSNGWITTAPGYCCQSEPTNRSLPFTFRVKPIIAAYWDNLRGMTACVESSANRLTIQFDGTRAADSRAVQMQVVLHPNHAIDVLYGPEHRSDGTSATVGVQDEFGELFTQVAFNTPGVVRPGTGVRLTPSR